VCFRWEKQEVVGQGRFGTVFKGRNVDSGQAVAVKQLHLSDETGCQASEAQEALRQLEREIGLVMRLKHRNVVQYFGTESQGGVFSIVMEYISGGSLRDLLSEEGPLTEGRTRLFTRQLLEGLRFLHVEHGIAHRDIKCANILLDKTNTIKLADFGASKSIAALTSARSARNGVGSPLWMAPEVIRMERHDDFWRKADVWSVGATVIEMGTGEPPWNDFSNPTAALFHIATTKDPPPFPKDFSPDATAFLRCCFTRNVVERASATDLLQHAFFAPRDAFLIAEQHEQQEQQRREDAKKKKRSDVQEGGGKG
jgi:mitogen-activated protein kinase kinase kinase